MWIMGPEWQGPPLWLRAHIRLFAKVSMRFLPAGKNKAALPQQKLQPTQ